MRRKAKEEEIMDDHDIKIPTSKAEKNNAEKATIVAVACLCAVLGICMVAHTAAYIAMVARLFY